MKSFQKILVKLPDWLQPEYKFMYINEIPDKVNDKTIYIIGDIKQPWLLVLTCPCGCKNLIQLNLLKDATPCWKYRILKKNKINISPSIWRINGCKSHFFVHKSKIKWAKNYNN